MKKEVSDALHFLLHCSLKDARFTTQKEQCDIVYKEIERLNKRNKEIYEGFMITTQELCEATKELEKANGRIKMALDYIKNAEGNDINYIATLLLGYPVEIEEKRKQVLDILGDDKE